MDNFISMATKGYAAYEESQHSQGQQSSQPSQGTQQYQDGQAVQDLRYQGGQGQGQGSLSVDHRQATQIANDNSGDSGNSELFSQAMAFVAGGNHSAPVNENEVTNAHQQVYGDGDASNVSASALGSAAALQTLKSFMSSGGQQNNSGSNMQTQMIGMAMSEAAKMFEQTGNTGDKQEAINGAAATMFKLMMQAKFSGGSVGGGDIASFMGGANSGGLSSLVGMASKFMN